MCSHRNAPLQIISGEMVDDIDGVDLFNNSNDKLGQGRFGLVKRAAWGTGKNPEVAIKRVDILPKLINTIKNELFILYGLTADKIHPDALGLKGSSMDPTPNELRKYRIYPSLIACVQDGDHLYIVQEMIDETSLADKDVRQKIRKDRPQDIFLCCTRALRLLRCFS